MAQHGALPALSSWRVPGPEQAGSMEVKEEQVQAQAAVPGLLGSGMDGGDAEMSYRRDGDSGAGLNRYATDVDMDDEEEQVEAVPAAGTLGVTRLGTAAGRGNIDAPGSRALGDRSASRQPLSPLDMPPAHLLPPLPFALPTLPSQSTQSAPTATPGRPTYSRGSTGFTSSFFVNPRPQSGSHASASTAASDSQIQLSTSALATSFTSASRQSYPFHPFPSATLSAQSQAGAVPASSLSPMVTTGLPYIPAPPSPTSPPPARPAPASSPNTTFIGVEVPVSRSRTAPSLKGKEREDPEQLTVDDEDEIIIISGPTSQTNMKRTSLVEPTESSQGSESRSSYSASPASTRRGAEVEDADMSRRSSATAVEGEERANGDAPARKRRRGSIEPELNGASILAQPFGASDTPLVQKVASRPASVAPSPVESTATGHVGAVPPTVKATADVKNGPTSRPGTKANKGKGKAVELVWPAPGYLLQTVKCISPGQHPLKDIVKNMLCQQCRTRKAGFVCSFTDLRSFPQEPDGSFRAQPTFLSTTAPDDVPNFPTIFNRPFTPVEANTLKTVAADKLGPTMQRELDHARRDGAVRIKRELGVSNTCDACLHAMLCGGWLCKTCGREICFDCFEVLKEHRARESPAPSNSASNAAKPSKNGDSPPSIAKKTLDKLEVCLKMSSNPTHAPDSFIPVTRIDRTELERVVREMEAWKSLNPLPPPKQLPPGWLDQYRFQPPEAENSLPYLRIPGTFLPPRDDGSAPLEQQSDDEDFKLDLPSPPPSLSGSPPPQSSPILRALAPYQPSYPPIASSSSPTSPIPLPSDFSPIELFRSLWSLGETLVVDVDTALYSKIQWTPQYFIDHFGDEPCTIGSNRIPGKEYLSTVREFFGRFGRKNEMGDSEKIKDWPPTNDFKNAYPDLWQDFMNQVPIGSVTRRDGVLNISSHTPHNANPPDLGPKGYFSQVSDDAEGGMGSTKLHTVNLLLWASEDSQCQAGVAIWDLFRAEDSDKIRDFLYELIAEQRGYQDAAEARSKHDDPIHTQIFFLNRALRKRLWEEKGVKSWRVHQRPGQVVFIPAGCAHQVCNFADCIKVASDFVSIENVGRCWTVTDEFRHQTKEKGLWRSDVLQLKSQLLWAWLSAERFDSPGGATGSTTVAKEQSSMDCDA
ncbi:hypothetical protein JCM5296_000789 [Sporobolomyces johnsonii]